MGFLTGIIGTISSDKPSHWSFVQYDAYKEERKKIHDAWKKAMIMSKGRFNIDIEKISTDDQVKVFNTFINQYMKVETYNPEMCLEERFLPYQQYVADEVRKYSNETKSVVLDNLTKRWTEEYVQAAKWNGFI